MTERVDRHLGEGGGEGRLSESLEVQQVVHALPHQGLILAVEHALVHAQQPGGMTAGPARRCKTHRLKEPMIHTSLPQTCISYEKLCLIN